MRKSGWVNVLVEDKGEGDRKVEDVETLCTQSVRQNFDGVGDNNRRERDAGKLMSENSIFSEKNALTRKRRSRGKRKQS